MATTSRWTPRDPIAQVIHLPDGRYQLVYHAGWVVVVNELPEALRATGEVA